MLGAPIALCQGAQFWAGRIPEGINSKLCKSSNLNIFWRCAQPLIHLTCDQWFIYSFVHWPITSVRGPLLHPTSTYSLHSIKFEPASEVWYLHSIIRFLPSRDIWVQFIWNCLVPNIMSQDTNCLSNAPSNRRTEFLTLRNPLLWWEGENQVWPFLSLSILMQSFPSFSR